VAGRVPAPRLPHSLMARAINLLPPAQLDRARAAYREASAAKRRQTLLGLGLATVAVVLAAISGGVALAKFARNIHRLPNYIHSILPSLSWANLGADLAEWFWNLADWLKLLGDTLLMAYIGTALGAVAGFLMSFMASANLEPRSWVRVACRRFMEFCRTVPEIVFALLFVVAFGLGPMPGVLALAIHTAGALGKLFAEAVENIDMKPVEGATATGANRVLIIRFAVLPQVLSTFASYALLRFEYNVRSAAVLGFVGAGGIGQDLMVAIRKFYYSDVSAILVLIIASVIIIDLVTERLRHRLIGLERAS
jgi:phosphonate transport system permease protein